MVERSLVQNSNVVSDHLGGIRKRLDSIEDRLGVITKDLDDLEKDLIREQEATKRMEKFTSGIGQVVLYVILAVLGWAGITLLNK